MGFICQTITVLCPIQLSHYTESCKEANKDTKSYSLASKKRYAPNKEAANVVEWIRKPKTLLTLWLINTHTPNLIIDSCYLPQLVQRISAAMWLRLLRILRYKV